MMRERTSRSTEAPQSSEESRTSWQPQSSRSEESDALAGEGRPLDAEARGHFEARFGYDFSRVRIHDDAEADRAANQLGAEAITRAEHIAFARDRYAPQSDDGRRLLAHELTHVVQQSRGESAAPPRARVAAPHDAAEREADAIAGDASRPGPWTVTQPATSALHRKPKPKDDEPKHKAKPKDEKSKHEEKAKAAAQPKVTVENVEDKYGPLTKEIAAQIFSAYGSPLAGRESDLISAFDGQGVSAWIGIAIIAQESSYANVANNKTVDERNIANPFSVHFTAPAKWTDACKKNALLMPDDAGTYTPTGKVDKSCAAAKFRLPTFAECAKASAKAVSKNGLEAYREEPGYPKVIAARMNDMIHKIKLQPK